MKNILITGGAGYLGSVMTGRFLQTGYHVTILDNLMYGQTSLLGYCGNQNFDFIRGDARDEQTLKTALKGKDVIIPLAAIVGMPACNRDPELARGVNLEAIRLLMRVRSKEQRIVYPCTNSGYGTKTGDVFCTEETPMEPISVYGETKVQAEKELLADESTVTLRLATVFGTSLRMRLDLLVNDFVHRAVTDGCLVIYEKDFKRNFVHIQDVAECFEFCIEHFDDMKGRPYNLGLDKANLSKAELVNVIKKQVPRLYVHYAEVGSDPDKRNYVVSNERLRRAGYEAHHSLEEGITQLIKLYRMLPRGAFYNV